MELRHGKRKLSNISLKAAERLEEYHDKILKRWFSRWGNIVFIMILWFLGVIYIAIRIFLLVSYLRLNKKMFMEMDIDRERRLKENESLDPGLLPNSLPIMPRKKTNLKYVYLLHQDQRIKQIGNVAFATLPLIAFVYQSITKADLSVMLQYIAFPVFLQSFNEIFKSYEIDNDILGMNMYHERILAKRRKGRPS